MPYREKLKKIVKEAKKAIKRGVKQRGSKKIEKSYKQDIKQRRGRLLRRIEDFHLEGQQFLDVNNNQQNQNNQASGSVDSEDDDDDGDEIQLDRSDLESVGSDGEIDADEFEDEIEEGDQQPENVPLQLPSMLGRKKCVESGKRQLMEHEIALREGQAHDALEKVKNAIAYKSYLWKEEYDTKASYKIRTRSLGIIHTVYDTINHHVAQYRLAFTALTRLNSQGQFQTLSNGDLKPNDNIVKENRIGQSSDTLSWIWRTGQIRPDEERDAWLQEGKQCSFLTHSEFTRCL